MPNVLSKPLKPTARLIPESRSELACLSGRERDELLKTVRAYDRRSGQPGWLSKEMGSFMEGSRPVAPDGWKIKPDGVLGEAAWRATKKCVILTDEVDQDFLPGLGKKPCGCKNEICKHVRMLR